MKSGQEVLAGIIAADLKGLLRRLTGLETRPLMTVRRLPMK